MISPQKFNFLNRNRVKRIATLSCLLALPALSHAADWEGTQDPFRLHGNSYHVGTQGLSSVLIASSAGHILIDGASLKAAAQIAVHTASATAAIRCIRKPKPTSSARSHVWQARPATY